MSSFCRTPIFWAPQNSWVRFIGFFFGPENPFEAEAKKMTRSLSGDLNDQKRDLFVTKVHFLSVAINMKNKTKKSAKSLKFH